MGLMTSIPWINYLRSISINYYYKIIHQHWIQFLRKYVILQPIGVGDLEQPGRLLLFSPRTGLLSTLGRALVFGTRLSYIQTNELSLLRKQIISFIKSSITTIFDSSDEYRMQFSRNGGAATEYGKNSTCHLGDLFYSGCLNRSCYTLPYCTIPEMRYDNMQVDAIRW